MKRRHHDSEHWNWTTKWKDLSIHANKFICVNLFGCWSKLTSATSNIWTPFLMLLKRWKKTFLNRSEPAQTGSRPQYAVGSSLHWGAQPSTFRSFQTCWGQENASSSGSRNLWRRKSWIRVVLNQREWFFYYDFSTKPPCLLFVL